QPCRPLHPILPMVFQAPLGGITSWCLACPQGEARLARARDSRRSRDQGRQHDPGSGDSDEPTPVTDSAAEKGGLSAILATKLHQPRLHPTTMDRPRLLTFLRSDPAKLVLVVAPPGFGKTTLVAQWREADERPFAWISLDRADNDPMVLWSYIVEAIGRVSSAFRQAAESTLRSGADLVGGAVPRILSDLESLDRDVVLVLDDYQWITHLACHESIALFAEHQPSHVQLVLCARVDPPIRLGRLRASGALAEIRLWDLSFTPEETEQ